MALLRSWMRSHPRALGLALGLGVAAGLAMGAALLGEWYLRRPPPPGERLDVTVEAVAPAPLAREPARPEPSAKTLRAADASPGEPPAAEARPPAVRAPQVTVEKEIPFDPNEWKTLLRFYEKDAAFGYKLRPLARATVTKSNGNALVYKAVYTTDEHGRRVMPAPDGPAPARAVFFLGCSYTFGWGVDDAETMPWKTAELAPYRRVYNFGVGGYGPQQFVELFKTDLSKEVPQKRSLAIFTFHHEHINRAAGTPRVARSFGGDFPWYALDEQTGRPVRQGSFRERPNAPANSGSKLLDAMRDYHGEVLTKDDARLAALLIDEARVLFEKRFASDGFYLLLYPARQDKLTDEVVRIVQAHGTKVLDYRHLLNAGGAPGGSVDYDRWFFPGDGHPNRDLHARMAAKIVQDLGLER